MSDHAEVKLDRTRIDAIYKRITGTVSAYARKRPVDQGEIIVALVNALGAAVASIECPGCRALNAGAVTEQVRNMMTVVAARDGGKHLH